VEAAPGDQLGGGGEDPLAPVGIGSAAPRGWRCGSGG
jgi:hypothetical protein